MLTELYSHYGSRLTTGTSEILYDSLLQDEALAPFFVNVDIEKLREHMADFISSLTGGPDIYSGKTMDDAHKDYAITPAHFHKVAEHLQNALLTAGITQDHTDEIMSAVASLSDDVINHP